MELFVQTIVLILVGSVILSFIDMQILGLDFDKYPMWKRVTHISTHMIWGVVIAAFITRF